MNLESMPSKKEPSVTQTEDLSMDEFDFKPITSGLGFHHNKPADIKPVFTEKVIQPAPQPAASMKTEMNVYQNDLSLFYNQQQATTAAPVEEEKEEKVYRLASKTQRLVAYVLDLMLLFSAVGIILTVMARIIGMDLLRVWMSYPNEITPLVLTVFCGFYIIYFSIFEKTAQSTFGKSVLGLRVVNLENEALSFSSLLLRSIVTLLNVVSLGLFSYFDLQNKVTSSKIIRKR